MYVSSASYEVTAGGGFPGLIWQLHALWLQFGSRQLTFRGSWHCCIIVVIIIIDPIISLEVMVLLEFL